MPNFFSPLLPTFGADEEAKKAVKKFGQYALGYTLAITIAKKFPTTAGPLGFLTGLNLQAGKGITVKPAAIPLLYAPQPVGVMPPRIYDLPNSLGDPLKLAKTRLQKDGENKTLNLFADDYLEARKLEARERAGNVAGMTPFAQQFAAELAAGRVPRPPSVADALGLSRPPVGRPALQVGDLVIGSNLFGADELSALRASLDQIAGDTLDARDRSQPPPMNEPEQPTIGADQVVGQIQRFGDFNGANPPDP